jgi:hypothetical protein
MRKSTWLLLFIVCLVTCVSSVQADQIVPFAPPGNVTGNYTYQQGLDTWQVNTNFPMSSQDIVFPEWLFGMMLVFMFITICFALVFASRDPAPWVNVIACGMVLFGLGLSAAMMAPLVGYTEVFHQIIAGVTSNTVYVNEIVVYTMGSWIGWACYGIAAGGIILAVAGLLLQMKAARAVTNAVQQEKIMGGEIDFRQKEKRSR